MLQALLFKFYSKSHLNSPKENLHLTPSKSMYVPFHHKKKNPTKSHSTSGFFCNNQTCSSISKENLSQLHEGTQISPDHIFVEICKTKNIH